MILPFIVAYGPRTKSSVNYWLEIVGYWTPEYLATKLGQLEAAQLQRLILCVDESRQCVGDRLHPLGPAVWYKGKVDVLAVIAIADPALAAALAQLPKRGRRLVASRGQ